MAKFFVIGHEIGNLATLQCRGRLKLVGGLFCSIVSLHCVTITSQYIFKCSLQVIVVSVFPHVTRTPTARFFHPDLLLLAHLGA